MANLVGNKNNNILHGGSANDTLTGGGGNDTLLGKQGIDLAKFVGPVSRYTFGTQGKYLYIQDSSNTDGRDLLSGIEKLGFTDATLTVSQYEFSIPHTSPALQTESAITTLANGNYVVTWTASSHWNEHGDLGIFAQRFNASGKALGSAITISESDDGVLCESSVSAMANGGFVVSWKDKIDKTVYAQTYSANGIAQSGAIVVSTDSVTSYGGLVDSYTARTATFDNGDFLVVDVASTDRNIYAQRYDSLGNTVGSNFRINTDTAGSQHSASITVLKNGNTASAWVVFPDDLDDDEFLRIQIHNGETPVGNAIDIAVSDSNIAALGDGGFVVTWRSAIYDAASDTYKPAFSFQRYDADGIAVGSTVQQRANIPADSDLTCTSLSNGGFVVVCGSVWARMYDTNGHIIGGEIDFSTREGGGDPSITASADGGFTVCWTSNYENGPLLYQSYDEEGNHLGLQISGTAKGETIKAGSAAMLAIHGGAGNDVLYGGTGAATLIGGSGDDLLFSGTGNDHFIGTSHGFFGNEIGDVVSYVLASSGIVVNMSLSRAQNIGGGMGMDTFDSTVESLQGSNYGDSLKGNGYQNNIKGGGGNDLIWGGDSRDILDGGSGSDTLRGGTGNDSLRGGSGNDTLRGDAGYDTLYADAGKDLLIGGTEADEFVLKLNNSGLADRDTIQDFSRAQGDKIALQHISGAKFDDSNIAENFRSGSNVKALDANDFVLYNTTTGILSYDPDGNGSKAAIALAVIGTTTHPTLIASDLYVLWA